MISPLEFTKRTIGKTVEEATKLVEEELRYKLRVIKIDGKLLDLTPDWDNKRANVGVENGIITEWFGLS